MPKFENFLVEEQDRSKREFRKRFLKKFRALPKKYPARSSWTENDKKEHTIVDDDIMSIITNELTENDPKKLMRRVVGLMLMFLLTII